jgi:hypothetical protein
MVLEPILASTPLASDQIAARWMRSNVSSGVPRSASKKYFWIIEGDISSYFDERYTALSTKEKTQRRKQGLSNFV